MRFPYRILPITITTLLLLSVASVPSHGELVGTILVSRHGTRAPNAVTSQLCPANSANLQRYLTLDISLEGVTGRGMHQLLQLGEYTRAAYVDTGFLKPYYSNEEMYIRAVGEDRTLQSAVAWGQGLYPAGHAPIGYRADLPSPLPVYTLPDELDVLLENRKAGCHQRLKEDVQAWDDTEGAAMRRQYAALLGQLETMCGVNLTRAINGSGDNYGDAVKDITDNWTFDFIEHFPPLPGLSLSTLLQFRQYAVQQLIGRILGTPEQVTYLNGDLPLSMLRSFKALIQHREDGAAQSAAGVKPLRFIAYHGHREMMYALAAFFDIRYNITYPALPLGAIPPATTLFFELHHVKDAKHGRTAHRKSGSKGTDSDEYVIKAVLWSPCDAEDVDDKRALVTFDSNATHAANRSLLNRTSSHHPHHTSTQSSSHQHADDALAQHSTEETFHETAQCGARPIAISSCPSGVCTYAQFRKVILAQIRSTGDWRKLCKYDEATSREEYDDGQQSDTKVPGAGTTQGDHSKSEQHTQPEEEEDEGDEQTNDSSHRGHLSSTAGAAHAQHSHHRAKNGDSHGWGWLLWALITAVVIGAVGYWWCFMRGAGRGDYRAVPDRV